MKNKQSPPNQRECAVVADPRQFGIIDLFAVTTLLALVSGMAAPFVQAMPSANRNKLFVVLLCQLFVTITFVLYASAARGKLLRQSGRRNGVGYCGVVSWRHWPLFKSIMDMLLLASVQLSLAVGYAVQRQGGIPMPGFIVYSFIVYSLQLGYFTGLVLCQCRWRVYPGAIEFFDAGIAFDGTKFIPWDRAEVRPSAYFADRVIVVSQPARESSAGDTKLAQVSDALREQLLTTTK